MRKVGSFYAHLFHWRVKKYLTRGGNEKKQRFKKSSYKWFKGYHFFDVLFFMVRTWRGKGIAPTAWKESDGVCWVVSRSSGNGSMAPRYWFFWHILSQKGLTGKTIFRMFWITSVSDWPWSWDFTLSSMNTNSDFDWAARLPGILYWAPLRSS